MKDRSLTSEITTTINNSTSSIHPVHRQPSHSPEYRNPCSLLDNTNPTMPGTRPRSGSHHDEDRKTHFLSKLIQNNKRHEGLGPSVSVMTIAPNQTQNITINQNSSSSSSSPSPSLSQRQKRRTGLPASLVVPDRAHSDPNIPISPHTRDSSSTKGTRKKKTNRTLDRIFKMLGKSNHDPGPSIAKEGEDEDEDEDEEDDEEDNEDEEVNYPHERRSASFGTTRSDISGAKYHRTRSSLSPSVHLSPSQIPPLPQTSRSLKATKSSQEKGKGYYSTSMRRSMSFDTQSRPKSCLVIPMRSSDPTICRSPEPIVAQQQKTLILSSSVSLTPASSSSLLSTTTTTKLSLSSSSTTPTTSVNSIASASASASAASYTPPTTGGSSLNKQQRSKSSDFPRSLRTIDQTKSDVSSCADPCLSSGSTNRTTIKEEENEVEEKYENGFKLNNNRNNNNSIETYKDKEERDLLHASSILIDSHTSSMIAGDRLSKRLSGGHYGSAGGLMMSTLLPQTSPPLVVQGPQVLEINNTNGLLDDDDGQTSISTEYTEEQSVATSSWSIRGPESIACTDISEASSMLHTPTDHQRKGGEPRGCGQLDSGDGNDAEEEEEEEEEEEDCPADYARRIWEEDETVCGDLEHVAEWMGNGKPLSTEILKYYMSHFDFTQMKLEDGFRTLCGKLHLKAEAQQIDRILEVFAQRYFACNPMCVFGSSDVIHAIIYSALMLNTDLHVAQGDYKKMSRSAFVRNTMSAILSQGNETTSSSNSSSSNINSSGYYQSDTEDMRRTPSTASSDLMRPFATTRYSKAWQVEIETVLKLMYNSIRGRQVLHPVPKHEASHQHARRRSLQVTGSRVGAFKRSVGTIMWKAARESIFVNDLAEFDAMYSPALPPSPRLAGLSTPEVPTFYGAGVPYYKDGLLVRKHLLEKANQKARHREWRDCFMVVEKGEIRMYKSDNAGQDPHRKSMMRSTMMASRANISEALSHSQEMTDVREGWQRIGEIDLKHTLSNPLPSGYSRQRPHAFALQQPNGGVYLFQVGSASEVLEWVETCNYWAARESREPLTGGISNMEYGWGECLDGIGLDSAGDPYYHLLQSRDTTVHEWQPPVPPSGPSTMDQHAQLGALHRHVRELNEELDKHRDMKLKMELRFLKSQGMQAMTNWENKSHYLLHEIIKYQNYCDAIEKAILAGKATPEERKKAPSVMLSHPSK